jgi:uncharacterized protein DUF1579
MKNPGPKPGPEHEKLSYFVGKWLFDGEVKPGPFGPSGKFAYTEICQWYEGRFAVVCNSDGEMLGRKFKGHSVMSYDPGDKAYVYFETNTIGETLVSRGKVDGDTWTWTGQRQMNGQPVRTRLTLKRVSADFSTYKFEMAGGDAPFAVVMEGKQTRL